MQPSPGEGQRCFLPSTPAFLPQEHFWAGPHSNIASPCLVLKEGTNDKLNEKEMAEGPIHSPEGKGACPRICQAGPEGHKGPIQARAALQTARSGLAPARGLRLGDRAGHMQDSPLACCSKVAFPSSRPSPFLTQTGRCVVTPQDPHLPGPSASLESRPRCTENG